MSSWFAEEGLISDSPANVSAAENAGNPHYLPTGDRWRQILPDELVLLDLWGKLDCLGAVFADITWMGKRAADPQRLTQAFAAVRDARDAAVAFVQQRVRSGHEVRGWEVDRPPPLY